MTEKTPRISLEFNAGFGHEKSVEDPVQFQDSSCGICCRQTGKDVGFSPDTCRLSCQYSDHFHQCYTFKCLYLDHRHV